MATKEAPKTAETNGQQNGDGHEEERKDPYQAMRRIEKTIAALDDADRNGVLAWLAAKYNLAVKIV